MELVSLLIAENEDIAVASLPNVPKANVVVANTGSADTPITKLTNLFDLFFILYFS
jgi:hypothetical protein